LSPRSTRGSLWAREQPASGAYPVHAPGEEGTRAGAVDEQDFGRAARLRDEERRLLSDRRAAEDEWLVAERVQEAGLAREDAADSAEDQPGDEAPGAASGQ
jgi:hypothetical protein